MDEFQSHAGSIEAGKIHRGRCQGGLRFNPTLVRLRPPELPREPAAPLSFNPTLVRLRPGGITGEDVTQKMFQSHAGSIEAFVSPTRLLSTPLSFNPTLVRLRRGQCPSRHVPGRGFNPTLVRLRHLHHRPRADHLVSFQSHAGSIEALPPMRG